MDAFASSNMLSDSSMYCMLALDLYGAADSFPMSCLHHLSVLDIQRLRRSWRSWSISLLYMIIIYLEAAPCCLAWDSASKKIGAPNRSSQLSRAKGTWHFFTRSCSCNADECTSFMNHWSLVDCCACEGKENTNATGNPASDTISMQGGDPNVWSQNAVQNMRALRPCGLVPVPWICGHQLWCVCGAHLVASTA